MVFGITSHRDLLKYVSMTVAISLAVRGQSGRLGVMSSIIFHTTDQEALVAMDTLAVTTEGQPLNFTSKALALPHLRLLIACTGAGGFVDGWLAFINGKMILRGIDHLNDQARHYLCPGWREFKEESGYPDELTTTVYHFGVSEITGLIHSYSYRSEKDFEPEKLPYGMAVKPEFSVPEIYELPTDIPAMMNAQRLVQDDLKSTGRKLYIGGEIQIHRLSTEGYSVYTMSRFDDYDTHAASIFGRLKR